MSEHERRAKAQSNKEAIIASFIILVSVIGLLGFFLWQTNTEKARLMDKGLCADDFVKKEGITMCKHQKDTEVQQAEIDAGLVN